MSLARASDTENMQVKINLSDKQSKNGDEQVEGMSVSDMPAEFTDPAILAVSESRKISYTKKELMNLRDAPMSKKKPDFFDTSEVSPSIFDPDRWNFERKKSDTPTESGSSRNSGGDSGEHRRRPGDPRERIRKENDGIVLSPQRRSFNSGCFVPVRVTAIPNRSHSPLGGKSEPPHMGIREIPTGNARRIGSGRILRDSWDFDKSSEQAGDGGEYGSYSSRGQGRNGDEIERKFERRSFGRDFGERESGGPKETRRTRGYDRRRTSDNREQEEPEWFSGGPISQNDTIELRGFDESDRPGAKKKVSPSRSKKSKEWQRKKSESKMEEAKEAKNEAPSERVEAGDGDGQKAEGSRDQQQGKPAEKNEPKAAAAQGSDQSFNFDEILKCDTIPLLTNGVGADGDNMKSRFSRWFKQESPEKTQGSRRSSMHDEHSIIKDLLNDIGETNVSIPGDSEAYFAPISPAGNGGGVIGGGKRAPNQQSQSINIMEMLQRGKYHGDAGPPKQPQLSGKILSLDELESKMRQKSDMPSSMPQKHAQQKPDEEMTAAFKKLLAQAQAAGAHSVSSNGPMNKAQPMSLLEMLSHSQQQDEAARMSGSNPHLLGPVSPNVMHHHPSDLSLKLQQVQMQQQQKQQMEMLNKLINATVQPPVRASPLHDIGVQQSRELLNRPEAQAILQAMHQRIPSPRELQVHTQNILQRALIKKKLEEQQENYRKKQEMQRGQSPNPVGSNGGKSVSSPTPLAFTPTSVLRKMTADKDEGKENKISGDGKIPPGRPVTGMRPQPVQQQWNPPFVSNLKQPAGRPIVKANANSYQGQTPEQFFGHHHQQQQQQRMFQQQQQQGVGPQPAVQHRKTAVSGVGGTAPTQYNPQYAAASQQFAQQLTQQQLRAQHQHRPVNQGQQQPQPQPQQQQGMSYPQQQQQAAGQSQQQLAWQQFFNTAQQAGNRNQNQLGRGGANNGDLSPTTTNQLARWFSPDLLERARGGELPSTAGLAQHALSLEEIERQTAPPVHN